VFLAIAARRVLLLATCYLADGAAVDALAFWSEASIAAHLLVVAEAIAACDFDLTAILGSATAVAMAVLAFWSEAAVSTNLLIMAWAIAGRAGLLITILSLAQWPPFSVGNFVLLDRYSLSSCVSKSKGRASVLVST
jgi:hypothetical protein